MWKVVEIVENVRVKSESRVADACLRNWHRTVVDHPVQHVADAGRGADGLGPEAKSRADRVVRLSRMTLTHEMARVLLLEQIYRGLTILRGKPYHRT